MKFIWEENDIRVGRRYSRPEMKEIWIIGYLVTDSGNQYTSISLSDGLVCNTRYSEKSAMALFLSDNHYIPKEFILGE